MQTITYAAAPTILTTSGALVFGLAAGNPDIEMTFVDASPAPSAAARAISFEAWEAAWPIPTTTTMDYMLA